MDKYNIKVDDIDQTLIQKHYEYIHSQKIAKDQLGKEEILLRKSTIEKTLRHLIQREEEIKQSIIKTGEYTYPLKEKMQLDHIDEILNNPTYKAFRKHWLLLAVNANYDIIEKFNDEERRKENNPDTFDEYQSNKYCCNVTASKIILKLDTRLLRREQVINNHKGILEKLINVPKLFEKGKKKGVK